MSEKEFLQQLFLLRQDIESCPMVNTFAAQQRDRWASRLGDLVNRRNAALDTGRLRFDGYVVVDESANPRFVEIEPAPDYLKD